MSCWTADPAAPIASAHLFADLDARLIRLLKSLTPDDWRRPTIVPRWSVHQIAAHLLDTALRRLSHGRDGATLGPPPRTAAEVVALVNGMNARGVDVFGRLSPPVLIALTEAALPELHAYLQSLDPMAPAAFGVSWAGEEQSANWFDVARELTERWHHQQQIRLAVEQPGIMEPGLYSPVLDCFTRGLPFAFRRVEATDGTLVQVTIAGDCGGTRWLQRRAGAWLLVPGTSGAEVSASVRIPQEIAWRVFTKGIERRDAMAQSTLDGDAGLAEGVFALVAVVG